MKGDAGENLMMLNLSKGIFKNVCRRIQYVTLKILPMIFPPKGVCQATNHTTTYNNPSIQ